MDEQENVRDVMSDVEAAMDEPWRGAFEQMQKRAMYYNRDGTPIVGPDATLQWARMFEDSKGRTVGKNITLYGEKLSTVFLGLDHSFMSAGPPILFETMLFAPVSDELKKAKRERLHTIAEAMKLHIETDNLELPEEKRIEKKYPHDQLQLRYASEKQAAAGHARLKLQCLIPPRWRRFLLYTIGGDATWE